MIKLEKYAEIINLLSLPEIERVKYLGFYVTYLKGEPYFEISVVADYLRSLGCPISNLSRMKNQYLKKSKDFKKYSQGKNDGCYVLSTNAAACLINEYGHLKESEEIISESELLDEKLFGGKRLYLDRLISQINNCYANNCFDACAVLMRRVFEIALIMAYEHHNIQDEIKNTEGNYLMLDGIVKNAVRNKTISLSRMKSELTKIKDLGNYAAHKIHYNTTKKDIDDIKIQYRAMLEELFYKAGLL